MNEIEKKIALEKEKAIKQLEEILQQYGHFPILEYYPEFEEKKKKGWHYTYPSIFVHANVIYSLLNIQDVRCFEIVLKSKDFLISKMERGGIWRFWDINDCQHPVPCGIDETAIASFVLSKLGIPLSNKKLLNNYWNNDGSIKTWIFPMNALLIQSPIQYFYLKKGEKKVKSTIDLNMLSLDDSEPVITASVLLYLKSKNLDNNTLNYICYHWNNFKSDNYSFYNKKIVYAYFIARALKEGVVELELLKNEILQYLKIQIGSFTFVEILLSILVYYYLKLNDKDYLNASVSELISKLDNNESLLTNYPFITSKDRVYFGGSNSLTLAWFLEVANYLEKENSL